MVYNSEEESGLEIQVKFSHCNDKSFEILVYILIQYDRSMIDRSNRPMCEKIITVIIIIIHSKLFRYF
jgi:hypothetical protein